MKEKFEEVKEKKSLKEKVYIGAKAVGRKATQLVQEAGIMDWAIVGLTVFTGCCIASSTNKEKRSIELKEEAYIRTLNGIEESYKESLQDELKVLVEKVKETK